MQLLLANIFLVLLFVNDIGTLWNIGDATPILSPVSPFISTFIFLFCCSIVFIVYLMLPFNFRKKKQLLSAKSDEFRVLRQPSIKSLQEPQFIEYIQKYTQHITSL